MLQAQPRGTARGLKLSSAPPVLVLGVSIGAQGDCRFQFFRVKCLLFPTASMADPINPVVPGLSAFAMS